MSGTKTFLCVARKKCRNNGLFVGDNVEFTFAGRRGCIEEVLPRTNKLIRPPVSNIDKVFIVTAPLPVPDLLLVDKILLNCIIEDIQPEIIVNKCDISTQHFIDRIEANYSPLNVPIIYASSHDGKNLDEIADAVKGCTAVFAGQSGVGKTSLLNVLSSRNNQVGDLAERINRGKQTTRHSEIFACGDGFLVDTPGFSLLDLEEESIKSSQLMTYYADFTDFALGCKFSTCTHISEPSCAVIKAVKDGLICEERYERYKQLYKSIKEKEIY